MKQSSLLACIILFESEMIEVASKTTKIFCQRFLFFLWTMNIRSGISPQTALPSKYLHDMCTCLSCSLHQCTSKHTCKRAGGDRRAVSAWPRRCRWAWEERSQAAGSRTAWEALQGADWPGKCDDHHGEYGAKVCVCVHVCLCRCTWSFVIV